MLRSKPMQSPTPIAQAAEGDLTKRPLAAWTAKANKRVQFGYGLNYLIDIENAVIVDVEPTPARTYDEVQSTKIMLDRDRATGGPAISMKMLVTWRDGSWEQSASSSHATNASASRCVSPISRPITDSNA